MPRRPLVIAASLTLLLLIAKLVFPAPALSDPAGGALPAGLHLSFPFLNALFAPLFDSWDGVTLLAMSRLRAFLWTTAALVALARIIAWKDPTRTHALWVGGFVLGLALFMVAGIRWRRPMAHLAGVPATLWVVDLHSHTNVSHDVTGVLQRDFDLETSRRWHARGGFDAFFVTDHNRIDGWVNSDSTPVACPGEELSLWRAHIVVLGNTDSIPRDTYADSGAGLTRLFGESGSRWGGITVASIPEYDENHFADLPEWIHAGVGGFEVSNAAPKANQQTASHRDSVVALARASGRWLAGVSDQHGMGATVQSWTLIPRVANGGRDDRMPGRCREILQILGSQGFGATQVVERHRLRVDAWWPRWTTPVAVVWEGWRAAGWIQVFSWLTWIWGVALFGVRRPREDPA